MGRKKKRSLAVGKVEVPQGYFLRMAKHDYNDYRKALPREFYQNSIDANAFSINVEAYESDRTIVIYDDGTGMDLKTLRNKLLVLGGSEKRTGATGAFGKAKELLFFAWEKYEIHTNNLRVTGAGADYRINRVKENFNGTKCTIWVPEDENFSQLVRAFRDVAKKFETSCLIYVNEEHVGNELRRGELVRTTDWCDLYVDPEVKNCWYINVRINGQWMFRKYMGDTEGEFLVELKHQSTDMLTSNRDGIKDKFSNQFDKLLKEVMVEREEMMNPKPELVRKLIRGDGNVKVNWEKVIAETQQQTESLSHYDLSDLNVREVLRIADEIDEMRFEQVKEDNPNSSVWENESKIAFIGYRPHFVLHYEKSDSRMVKTYMRSRRAKVLADLWTENLKQVLLDIGFAGEFVAGFSFDSTAKASFIREDGIPMFLLNPNLICKEIPEVKNPFHQRAFLKLDVRQSACHEVTHLNHEYHDGSFLSRFEWVQAQTWKSEKIYTKIAAKAFRRDV